MNQKESDLRVERRDYGYVQKYNYCNMDLLHEEVLDLDSPFATLVSAETLVLTYLLIGDQNAGKSSKPPSNHCSFLNSSISSPLFLAFIQSFTYHNDANWMDILCELPILTSSFINTRFFPGKSDQVPAAWKPRDEPPFIDTDLARGTLMLTRDDFMFLLDERGLPVPPHPLLHISPLDPLAPRYVVIQLIEIGGDHIDLLMAHKAGRAPPELSDIAKQSHQLLKTASRTMYFVNVNTLFSKAHDGAGEEVEVDKKALETLRKRMEFLNETYPPGHEIVFNLMRAPADMSDPISKFTSLITSLQRSEGWKFGINEVRLASHLTTDGDLNVEGVISTLCRLLAMNDEHDMATNPRSAAGADALVVPHVIAAASAAGGSWVSQNDFEEYIEGIHFAELPVTTMLQCFQRVARAMAAKNVLIESVTGPIRVSFSGIGKDVCLKSYDNEEMYAMRLPTIQSVREAITSFALRDVPAHIWFTQDPVGDEMKGRLLEPVSTVEEAIAGALTCKDFKRFVVLLEDWVLCKRLSGSDALELNLKTKISGSDIESIPSVVTQQSPAATVRINFI